MRWSIARLLHITLIAALVLTIVKVYRGYSPHLDDYLMRTANVVALTFASLGAYYSSPDWRRAWLGFAIFGWVYQITCLRVFGGDTDTVLIGWMAGGVSALLAMLLPLKQ